MDTIKFNRMTDLSTERHNPEDEKSQLVLLFSEKTMISNPLNLNIVISYGCNCVGDFYMMKQEEKIPAVSDEEYLSKLEIFLSQLDGLPIEITITGGEPTLCPERLIPVLHMVQKHGFQHRTFLTNGSGLLKEWHQKPIIQYLKEMGAVYNINLSRQHMNETKNRQLINGEAPTIRDLKQISSFCDVNHMDIRLSCNIMKNGVHDFASMMEYMEFAEDIGFQHMIFREVPNKAAEYVPINPVMDNIKNSEPFKYIKTIKNSHYTIDVLHYESYIVKLYRSKRNTNILSNLVYREGRLSNSWETDHFYEVKK